MSEEEAIKLLKEVPDYSLSYYKREYAVDIVLKVNEQLHSIIKEARELLKATEIENSWFKQFKKKQLEILYKEDK